MKTNKHGRITGRIRASKILKDPSNNIAMSQIVSKDFKNTKTQDELESIKKLAKKSMKKPLILLHATICSSAISILLLIGFFITIGLINTMGSEVFPWTIVCAVAPVAIMVIDLIFVFGFWPFDDYWIFRKFLVDIKPNLSDNPDDFPLTLQVLYFKQIRAKLSGLSKITMVSFDDDPGSRQLMRTWQNTRVSIEFPNFIIKYVDYCLAANKTL